MLGKKCKVELNLVDLNNYLSGSSKRVCKYVKIQSAVSIEPYCGLSELILLIMIIMHRSLLMLI